MNFIGSGLVFVFFLASQGAAQNAKLLIQIQAWRPLRST